MSTGVTSDTGDAEKPQVEEAVLQSHQNMEDLEDRLLTLSDNINLCKSVINDLVALKHVLVRKSLQDVPVTYHLTKEE